MPLAKNENEAASEMVEKILKSKSDSEKLVQFHKVFNM